jgi:Formyl transferase, C-terminal domain
MRLHAYVHNEWTALVVSQLLRLNAPISAVAMVDGMHRQWHNLSKELPHDEDGEPDAMLVGAGAPAADDRADPARLVIHIATEDGVPVDDPLRWSVLNANRQLVLCLRGLPPAKVDVCDDYFGTAVNVALVVRPMLDEVKLAEVVEPEVAQPGPVLTLDRHVLRIDWMASAKRVVRTVRAGEPRLTAAWTHLNGFPVSVGKAWVWGLADQNVAPGTIVRSGGDATVVQTGHGQVRIAEVTDIIGPLQPVRLAPGMRFGIDLVEDIVTLRGRVADLEQVVRLLTRDRDRVPVVVPVRVDPAPVAP